MAGGINPSVNATDTFASHMRQINQRLASLERAASNSGGGGGGGSGADHWNSAWGMLATASAMTTQSAIGATATELSVSPLSVTVVGGRRQIAVVSAMYLQATAAGSSMLRLLVDGVEVWTRSITTGISERQTAEIHFPLALADGTHSIKATIETTAGTLTVRPAGSAWGTIMWVQDVGPVTRVADETTPPASDWTAADERYVNTAGDEMTGSLAFQSIPLSQRLNLYGIAFGVGIQASTQYFRSSANFAFFKGGVHSDTQLDPGAGGTLSAYIDSVGNLYLPNRAGGLNMVLGASASAGARLRLHVPATGENNYIDFEGDTAGAGTLIFRSGTAQRLVLAPGYVGHYPDTDVRVYRGSAGTSAGPHLSFYETASRRMYIQGNATYSIVQVTDGPLRLQTAATTGGSIDFYTLGAYEARIDASGNLYVTMTTLQSATAGAALSSGGRLYTTTAAATHYNWVSNIIGSAAGAIHAHFRRSDTAIGSITQSGATTGIAFNTTSHGPFKGDITDLDGEEAIKLVKRLRPRRYRWKVDANGEMDEDGEPGGEYEHDFVAQELNKVVPRAVTPGHGRWSDFKKWRERWREFTEAETIHAAWEQQPIPDDPADEFDPGPEPKRPPKPPLDPPFEPWMTDKSRLIPDLTAALLGVIKRVEKQDDEIRALRKLLDKR